MPYWYVDTAMATLLMLLTAVDEGLGACLFGIMRKVDEGEDPADAVASHTAAFKAEFGIPEEYDPIGGITVGYRATDLPPQSPGVADRRHGTDEVVHRGRWGRH